MKAAQFQGDLTFSGLLQRWEEDGAPPEVLVDYLLDLDLTYQAENVRWCVEQGTRNGTGGIRPFRSGNKWTWMEGNIYRSDIGHHRFRKMFVGTIMHHSDSYRNALIALIDCEPATPEDPKLTTKPRSIYR